MNNGFIKNNRTDAAKNLHSRPNENHLLNIIAHRVSRNGNPVKGVEKGEALIGDYEKIGLKRQPYRTALSNLKKWGYVTTRVTNRTTYARLSNTDTYDCNVFEGNQQDNPTVTTKPTNLQPVEQPTSNHNQELKKKEDKKEEGKKYIYLEEFQKIKKGHQIRVTQLDNNFHFGLFKESWSDEFKNQVLGMWRYLESKEHKPNYWGNIGTLTTQLDVLKSMLNQYTEQEVIKSFTACKMASKKSWNMYLKSANAKPKGQYHGEKGTFSFNQKITNG